MKSIGLVLSLLIGGNTFAYHEVDGKAKEKDKGNNGGFVNKANCSPATAKLIFEFNDVRAQLNTNGVLFRDRANNVAAYEVPKSTSGDRLTAIYAAALWMGGTDVNGQLKLAAAKFGDGNDFWTGPLTVTAGTGTIDLKYPVGNEATRDFGDAISMDAQQFAVLPECKPHPIGQGCCFLAVVCVLQEKCGIGQGFEV